MTTENVKGTEVTLVIPSTDQLGQLRGLTQKYKTNAGYRTQEDWAALKDRPVRAIYLGMKEIPNDQSEVVNCAVFASETEVFLSAQKVLVDSVKTYPSGTPFEITYRGKKKNVSVEGSTNIFDVFVLGEEENNG